jgi:hypothetical protein
MAVAELGWGLNMLPIARNYPLLSVDVVQQNGGDKLYDKATPRDQQQGGQQKTQQQQQQQQMQAQVPQANGGGVVVRESSKALDYEAAEGLDGGSSIVSNDSMRELEELLTKLNPLAKEFVPPSHSNASSAAALAASIPKQISRRVTTTDALLASFLFPLSYYLCSFILYLISRIACLRAGGCRGFFG